MNEWNIQARAHRCQACDQEFLDKQSFRTLLLEERHAYVRKDICEACWKNVYHEGNNEPREFVAFWQGAYQVPPPTPPDPIQKENAETLLRKLFELNKPQFAPAAYILAVMLERKRLLKIKEQLQRDGQRIFIYEQPKSGDIFTIADPNLQLNELEDVQRIVAALLEYGLTPEGEIAWPVESASEPPDPLEVEAADEAEDTSDLQDQNISKQSGPGPDPVVEEEPAAR